MKNQNETGTVEIERFIQSMLVLCRLKKGRDYKISKSQLFIRKNPLRGKLLSVLKEVYPEYNFYWENAKTIRWF